MDKIKKDSLVNENKNPTGFEGGEIKILETMEDVKIILDDIFAHASFKEYLSKGSNENRINKYKIALLNIIKEDLKSNGGGVEDVMVMEAVKDYVDGKAPAVLEILEKMIKDGFDESLELRKIKKKNKESNKSELVENRKAKDFEKMEKVIGTNKGEFTENIERYKKSLITVLAKLKDKFREFLDNDLKDNLGNDENRRKFFQAMNRYEEKVEELLKSKENSKDFYDKLRDLHTKIEQDLSVDWSVDKLKNGKPKEKEESNLESVEIIEEEKETKGQEKRRKSFERKYGKDVNYVKYENGFPISSFQLIKIIIKESKTRDEVKIVLDDGKDNGKEKIITIKEFQEMTDDGYEKEKIETSIDTSIETSMDRDHEVVDNPADLPLERLKDLTPDEINVPDENKIGKEKKIENNKEKFNKNEKKILEGSENIALKFIEKQKDKFDWENFPKGRIPQLLEIQAIKFLMDNFKKHTLFADKEEETAELIVGKIKDKF